MTIAIVFDSYASLIECTNIEILNFEEFIKNFEDWLYEDSGMGYLTVKESLNITVLDTLVVIRYITEKYPNCNVTITKEKMYIKDVDESLAVIAL